MAGGHLRRRRVEQVVAADLVARTEERLAVESGVEQHAAGRGPADSGVRAAGRRGYRRGAGDRRGRGRPVAVAGPEPITERFIRVIGAGTDRLVTVIEFLSPTNKSREGVAASPAERRDLHDAGVNLVEIDLIREGNWRALSPHGCPADSFSPTGPRFGPPGPAAVYLYPVRLGEALPDVQVPLRPNDPPVALPCNNSSSRSTPTAGTAGDRLPPTEPPLAERTPRR